MYIADLIPVTDLTHFERTACFLQMWTSSSSWWKACLPCVEVRIEINFSSCVSWRSWHYTYMGLAIQQLESKRSLTNWCTSYSTLQNSQARKYRIWNDRNLRVVNLTMKKVLEFPKSDMKLYPNVFIIEVKRLLWNPNPRLTSAICANCLPITWLGQISAVCHVPQE